MSFEAGKPDRKTTAKPESRLPPRPGVAPPAATVNGVPQASVAGDIPVATVAVAPAAKPPPPPPPMIELINFGKRYGEFTAVEALNLRIPKGELYGFIGPNGAGKSTTIRFLATLLKASHGEGIVNGHSVTRDPLGVRRCVGYMPDNFGVYDGMRVWEFLDFFAVAYQIPKAKRKQVIGDVLELLDLTHKRDDFVNGLSRGMKQRLCLAKTLVHDPPLLILDEPSSGLDPRARMEFKALMKELRRMGKTILVSSHILSELADICTSIGIIERGQLLMHGPIDQVYRQIRRNRLVEIKFVEGMDVGLSIIRSHPAMRSVTEDENRVTVELEGSDTVVADLLDQLVRQQVRIRSFADKDPTLEDVFMMVTKGIVA
jgi:ABC-2 type transport system ATP-binding protein